MVERDILAKSDEKEKEEAKKEESGSSLYLKLKETHNINNIIKNGAFSLVYVGTNRKTGKVEAIKAINLGDVDVNLINKEIFILKECRHPNIVKYYRDSSLTTKEGDHKLIYMKYYTMTLQQFIEKHKNGVSRDIAINYLVQIVKTVQYLHENSIIHRDLKPPNIFVENDTIIIGDFNISKIEGTETTSRSKRCCTPKYAPPEWVSEDILDPKFDVWSIGCIYYELLTGSCAFQGFNQELRENIMKIHYIEPKNITQKDSQILRATLAKLVNRKTIKELLEEINPQFNIPYSKVYIYIYIIREICQAQKRERGEMKQMGQY